MRIQAKVLWFDKSSGSGSFLSLDGNSIGFIYACNIPGKKTLFPHTACVYYNAGDVIDVEWIDTCNLWISHTRGIFDHELWNSIPNKENLSFTVADDGKLISGLFK